MPKYLTPTSWKRFTTQGIVALMLFTSVGQAVQADENSKAPTNQVSAEVVVELAQASTMVKVGQAAPNFTGVDSTGKTHNLSDFRGKVVVLEWTNHQCPFVRKHYESGNMQRLQADATSKGIVWLSIISSAPGNQGYVEAAEANMLTENRGANPSAVLLDTEGKIGKMYNARTTPHMFVIDKQGIVKYMGAIDSIYSTNPADIAKAENYVQKALTSVLAGQPVETAVTQPYGCSVKYGS